MAKKAESSQLTRAEIFEEISKLLFAFQGIDSRQLSTPGMGYFLQEGEHLAIELTFEDGIPLTDQIFTVESRLMLLLGITNRSLQASYQAWDESLGFLVEASSPEKTLVAPIDDLNGSFRGVIFAGCFSAEEWPQLKLRLVPE